MPRITDKVMVITEHGDRDQIAVLEEDVLVQHYVTRTGAHSMVGNVYLGRVQNVLPGHGGRLHRHRPRTQRRAVRR